MLLGLFFGIKPVGSLIHSCNPSALTADAEGGGKSRRRRKPARNCILVSFSYLFQIPTASHLFAHHFPRPTRSKSPKRSTAQGQGSHFTATGYVQLPWAIHHTRNLSGFPLKPIKIRFCLVFPWKWCYQCRWAEWKWNEPKLVRCTVAKQKYILKLYSYTAHFVKWVFINNLRPCRCVACCGCPGWRKPYQRALSSSWPVTVWGALVWPYHLITSQPPSSVLTTCTMYIQTLQCPDKMSPLVVIQNAQKCFTTFLSLYGRYLWIYEMGMGNENYSVKVHMTDKTSTGRACKKESKDTFQMSESAPHSHPMVDALSADHNGTVW